MSSWELSRKGWVRKTFLILAVIIGISTIALGVWLFRLDRNIKTRFAEKRFAPPVEFYSAPEIVRPGSSYPLNYFETLFARKNFRHRDFGQPIQPGDYSVWSAAECQSLLQVTAAPTPAPASQEEGVAITVENPPPPPEQALARCFAFRNATPTIAPTVDEESVQIVALSTNGAVLKVYSGAQPIEAPSLQIEADLFAQYYGNKPVLRKVVSLGTVPSACLNALLAIEDSDFLEHPGISITGLARAILTNLRAGRRAQGGSTITQQLVKNYFLTDEKTFSRKATEIAMATLVERHATKDDILETYINLIYMGQNGPFEVRGFAAASEHYFAKPLEDLSLDQCATLAAVLNSPGLYNPFQHPDRAIKRRTRVLDRMLELKFIDEEQARVAKAASLPTKPQRLLTEPAPYFVQAVRREIEAKGIDETEGLRVYTTLNLRAQETAHQAVRAGLTRLETTVPHLKKLKEKGKNLEAVFISSDPRTGYVEALVGGRGYLVSQYNRAVDSRRQVGSVMKPFVYLTAFENLTTEGTPYTPLTMLKDEATTHKFEGQTWTPRNYDGTYKGEVPLFWSLKESLNASTVNLGMSVGISNIVDTAHRLGVTSKMSSLPSITLGAFEMSPMEVLQSYGSLATLGTKFPLTLIRRIDALDGTERFRFDAKPEVVAPADATAELVGVMKQTLVTGTARSARLSGFTHPAAGKTGTTNDKKDAWFAGFTPYHTAIVWVGYDDNTPHELTGGSGAVPIWTSYMKTYGSGFPAHDFPWPENTERVVLSAENQMAFGVPLKKGEETLEPIELIFRKGESPIPAATPAESSNPFD
jgi:penicillin-binding protein 1B